GNAHVGNKSKNGSDEAKKDSLRYAQYKQSNAVQYPYHQIDDRHAFDKVKIGMNHLRQHYSDFFFPAKRYNLVNDPYQKISKVKNQGSINGNEQHQYDRNGGSIKRSG